MPSVTVAWVLNIMQEKMRQLLFSSITAVALIAATLPCYAEEIYGKVVGVSDGDTITVLSNNTPYKIRLSGIDCPEKSQAFGQQAKAFTSSLAFNQDVKIVSAGHDRYRRTIGEVFLSDGRNLNDLLLENGYAWWYQKYSHDEYRHELQDSARKSKLGLWNNLDSEAPWDYRKMHHR